MARDVKELLEQAAVISTGGDVTAFVVAAATERAHRVLDELEVTRIDNESRRRFYDLVMNPPEPSRALRKLLKSDPFHVID